MQMMVKNCKLQIANLKIGNLQLAICNPSIPDEESLTAKRVWKPLRSEHSYNILALARSVEIAPKWRNGRRAGFKIRCPQGRVGSTPTFGTQDLRQIVEAPKKAVSPISLHQAV
jgi:hypothetical protein